LIKVPDGPTDNEVAALQPIGGCLEDVRAAEIKMKDTVVVFARGYGYRHSADGQNNWRGVAHNGRCQTRSVEPLPRVRS